jgi:hypothetical protein
MTQNSVYYFKCKIKTFAVTFKHFDNSCALLIMGKTAFCKIIQSSFTGVTKRCMSKIMPKRTCLSEILIKS